MKGFVVKGLLFFVFALAPTFCYGQCQPAADSCRTNVPHYIKYNGALRTPAPANHAGVVSLRLAIYSDATGGTALWQEIQNTQLDSLGRYEVVLGATSNDGVPADLFAA